MSAALWHIKLNMSLHLSELLFLVCKRAIMITNNWAIVMIQREKTSTYYLLDCNVICDGID